MLFDFAHTSVSQQALTLLDHEARKEAERLAAIARNWRYYDGDLPKMLVIDEDQVDDNVRVNLVQLVVDTGVEMLFGDDLGIGLDEDMAETPDEEYLAAVWERNRKMALLADTATNGALAGHAFWKLQPVPGVQPRTELPDTLPRIVVVDPSTVHVVWEQDDFESVVEYRITWTIITSGGKPAVRRQRIVAEGLGWLIIDEISTSEGRRFEELERTAWTYPWPPIIHGKNLPAPNEFYGSPDVDQALRDLNDSMNAVLSNARKVSRLHGHPMLWGSGMSGETDVSLNPGEMLMLPDAQSRIGNLSPIPSVQGHLDLAARLKAAFMEGVRVPEITTGKLDNVGQLSGLALSILYGPLVRKTEVKRRHYGYMIDELNRRLLEIADFEPRRTKIDWPAIVPKSDLEEAQTAEARQRAGVSKATTLTEMGYDAEVETLARRDERDASLVEAMTAFDRGQEDIADGD